MAYRETRRIAERKRALRRTLLEAARRLVAEGGFRAVRVGAVARRAGVATGTVYRYFPSKAELMTEVFRSASQHELDALREAARVEGDASTRIARVIRTFAERALRGRRLAYALIAEPADPAVDAERLVFRRAYADLWERLLAEGIQRRELPEQDVATAAAALTGALAEALVGPLSPSAAAEPDREALIAAIVQFGLRAVTGEEPSHEQHRYQTAS